MPTTFRGSILTCSLRIFHFGPVKLPGPFPHLRGYAGRCADPGSIDITRVVVLLSIIPPPPSAARFVVGVED